MKHIHFLSIGAVAATLLLSPRLCMAAQWITGVVVTQAVVGNSGGEYVQILVSGTVINPAGCASPDSYIVHDAALVKDALAISLAAAAADRQIRVYVTDTCDAATGRPLVASIGFM